MEHSSGPHLCFFQDSKKIFFTWICFSSMDPIPCFFPLKLHEVEVEESSTRLIQLQHPCPLRAWFRSGPITSSVPTHFKPNSSIIFFFEYFLNYWAKFLSLELISIELVFCSRYIYIDGDLNKLSITRIMPFRYFMVFITCMIIRLRE